MISSFFYVTNYWQKTFLFFIIWFLNQYKITPNEKTSTVEFPISLLVSKYAILGQHNDVWFSQVLKDAIIYSRSMYRFNSFWDIGSAF